MTDLTLLHTSSVHIPRFDALCPPGKALAHLVREDLLARARAEGVTPDIAAEVAALVQGAAGPVLCTCSTLGAAAEAAGALRIDRPAMQAAADSGGRVLMVYCLESTEAPSRALLEEEMAKAGNSAGIEPLFVTDAWPHFEAGDDAAFWQAIAEAVRKVAGPDLGAVLLAQASMDGAARRLGALSLPVFATPDMALRAAL